MAFAGRSDESLCDRAITARPPPGGSSHLAIYLLPTITDGFTGHALLISGGRSGFPVTQLPGNVAVAGGCS